MLHQDEQREKTSGQFVTKQQIDKKNNFLVRCRGTAFSVFLQVMRTFVGRYVEYYFTSSVS